MSKKLYRINEIFFSLQGEGARAGSPNIFIRFSNCNLRCSVKEQGFDCDTEFLSGKNLTALQILARVKAIGGKCKNIIFTGGEPGLQVDAALISLFKNRQYYLAIETNGTQELRAGLDWVCVSPKTAEHTIKVSQASEVKYVRGLGQEIPKTKIIADHYFISPAFDADGLKQEVLSWCVNLVKANPEWKISVQQHKTWGIR